MENIRNELDCWDLLWVIIWEGNMKPKNSTSIVSYNSSRETKTSARLELNSELGAYPGERIARRPTQTSYLVKALRTCPVGNDSDALKTRIPTRELFERQLAGETVDLSLRLYLLREYVCWLIYWPLNRYLRQGGLQRKSPACW